MMSNKDVFVLISKEAETMGTILELTLPYPPTINSYYTVARGRKILSKRGRDYKTRVKLLIGRLEPLLEGNLSAVILLFAPDLRRRDADNGLKALFDSLSGLIYKDDSQIKLFTVYHTVDRNNPRVELELETFVQDDQEQCKVIQFPPRFK